MSERADYLTVIEASLADDSIVVRSVVSAESPDKAMAVAGFWMGRRYRGDIIITNVQVHELSKAQGKQYGSGEIGMEELAEAFA